MFSELSDHKLLSLYEQVPKYFRIMVALLRDSVEDAAADGGKYPPLVL